MNQVQKIVMALCRTVDTPRALSVFLLAKHNEWAQLQQLRLRSPFSYSSSEEYRKDALVTELLRKCNLSSVTKNDTRQAAVDTFWSCEAQNAKTNSRLRRFLPEHLLIETPEEVRIHDFIREWRKEVSRIVGPLPKDLMPRFSPGATVSDQVPLTTIPDKMTSVPTFYSQTADLLQYYWESGWGRVNARRRIHPLVSRGNVFFTVPKDSDKDRGCAKEASLNVGFQLDVAQTLRRHLKRATGIELSTAEPIHRKLAQRASVDGTLATLDMSNASDTVASVLVKLLLPQDWFTLLDSLRARFTRLDGRWVKLEKFSTMGNGFTFELETIIFTSLARTIVHLAGGDPDEVRCYGDDLIVQSDYALDCLAALKYFGFTPNNKKSFWEGPFRESCGGDFFNGEPVRAHYVKEVPDEPHKWIALANGLNAADPTGRYVHAARKECLKNLPSAILRCRGPKELGDLAIHPTMHERIKHQASGTDDPIFGKLVDGAWHYLCYCPIPIYLKMYHWHDDVVLQSMLKGIETSGLSPRGGVSGYRLKMVADPKYSDWLPVPFIAN